MQQQHVDHSKKGWHISFWRISITKFTNVKAFEYLADWMTPDEWRHIYAFDVWKWSFIIVRRNR